MAATLRRPGRGRNPAEPSIWSGLPETREPGGELAPRAEAELAVDPGQVRLDRLRARERRGGDLPVRTAGRRELGDPPLARGQGPRRARPQADARELLPRTRRPQRRAETLEDLLRAHKRARGGGLLPRAALHRSGGEQGPPE